MFNGATSADTARLEAQLGRIWRCMNDCRWRTLRGISEVTGDPEAGISAQLRHLRKKRFGAHTVDKQHMGHGLYLYRVLPNLRGET